METRQALLVDAFADEPTAGNPVGVVPGAADLADDQMRALAGELGASETAFVVPSDEADRRLRFFTPEAAVDSCGHATVAAHSHLFERGVIDEGTHSVETAAGVFDVEVTADGTVWADQPDAQVRRADLDHETVADALGVDVASLRDVGADVPLGRASTGTPFLLVPVNYFEHLSDADPDVDAIADLCASEDAAGLYAFTFDTLDVDSTAHARGFTPASTRSASPRPSSTRAPEASVHEDPVSGTAAGALGAYLRRHGVLDGEFDEIVLEQGHFLDRPGRVSVETDGDEVRVGGRAVTTLDGELVVPDVGEDDIIEV